MCGPTAQGGGPAAVRAVRCENALKLTGEAAPGWGIRPSPPNPAAAPPKTPPSSATKQPMCPSPRTSPRTCPTTRICPRRGGCTGKGTCKAGSVPSCGKRVCPKKAARCSAAACELAPQPEDPQVSPEEAGLLAMGSLLAVSAVVVAALERRRQGAKGPALPPSVGAAVTEEALRVAEGIVSVENVEWLELVQSAGATGTKLCKGKNCAHRVAGDDKAEEVQACKSGLKELMVWTRRTTHVEQPLPEDKGWQEAQLTLRLPGGGGKAAPPRRVEVLRAAGVDLDDTDAVVGVKTGSEAELGGVGIGFRLCSITVPSAPAEDAGEGRDGGREDNGSDPGERVWGRRPSATGDGVLASSRSSKPPPSEEKDEGSTGEAGSSVEPTLPPTPTEAEAGAKDEVEVVVVFRQRVCEHHLGLTPQFDPRSESVEQCAVIPGALGVALAAHGHSGRDDQWLFEQLSAAAVKLPSECVWKKGGGKYLMTPPCHDQRTKAIIPLVDPHCRFALSGLVRWVETFLHARVDMIQINLHPDQSSWHGQHHDAHSGGTDGKKRRFTICFSLGSSRALKLGACCCGSSQTHVVSSGDAMVFNTAWNANHTHGVPPLRQPCGPRISIAMICS
eukprot:Hpha_TRINITY_DN9009_c0_g1::TRINITY_DN9009_c0_g1_i1::g.141909::m.141909